MKLDQELDHVLPTAPPGATDGSTIVLAGTSGLRDTVMAILREALAGPQATLIEGGIEGLIESLLAKRPTAWRAAPTTDYHRGGLTNWQMRQVASFVEENLTTNIRNAQLACAARLSVSHFCRSFRKSNGATPHVYIMQRRIELAKSMMRGTCEPLSQIAMACGFSDQAHLSRLFKRFEGQSPLVWRRQHCTPVETDRSN